MFSTLREFEKKRKIIRKSDHWESKETNKRIQENRNNEKMVFILFWALEKEDWECDGTKFQIKRNKQYLYFASVLPTVCRKRN